MIVHATSDQALGILGAMRRVAEAGGAEPLRPADRAALEAAYRYVFKGPTPLNVEGLPPSAPASVAARAGRSIKPAAAWKRAGWPLPSSPPSWCWMPA